MTKKKSKKSARGKVLTRKPLPSFGQLYGLKVDTHVDQDIVILVEALENLYVSSTENTDMVMENSDEVKVAMEFATELSRLENARAFFGHLSAAAEAMRAEHNTRALLSVAISMLRERGVTKDEFSKKITETL